MQLAVVHALGPVAPVRGEGTLSFDYTLAAEAECAYTFFLDARHSRRADVDVGPEESPTVTESVTALIVNIQVSRYRKVALNVLAVQIWLFTVPPTFI